MDTHTHTHRERERQREKEEEREGKRDRETETDTVSETKTEKVMSCYLSGKRWPEDCHSFSDPLAELPHKVSAMVRQFPALIPQLKLNMGSTLRAAHNKPCQRVFTLPFAL